jgi:hypothetical protein
MSVFIEPPSSRDTGLMVAAMKVVVTGASGLLGYEPQHSWRNHV